MSPGSASLAGSQHVPPGPSPAEFQVETSQAMKKVLERLERIEGRLDQMEQRKPKK
jgi:hypothetical protein